MFGALFCWERWYLRTSIVFHFPQQIRKKYLITFVDFNNILTISLKINYHRTSWWFRFKIIVQVPADLSISFI